MNWPSDLSGLIPFLSLLVHSSPLTLLLFLKYTRPLRPVCLFQHTEVTKIDSGYARPTLQLGAPARLIGKWDQ